MAQREHGDGAAETTLSERTKVSWGLVAALVSAIFAMAMIATTVVWWAGNFAGNVTAKLSSIENMLQVATANDKLQESKIAVLDQKQAEMESEIKAMRDNGTPALQARIKEVDGELRRIDTSLKLLEARNGNGGKP